MPIKLRTPEEVNAQYVGEYRAPTAQTPSPSFMDVLGASFETENTFSAVMSYLEGYPGHLTAQERDAFRSGAFNPLDVIAGTEWEDPEWAPRLARARSQRELDWMTDNFRRQRKERELLASVGFGESIAPILIATATDPMFAPVYAVPVIRAGVAGTAAMEAGAASVSVGTSEAILHGVQPDRTASESVYNIGGAALFGSVMGGFAGRATPAERIAGNAGTEQVDGRNVFLGDSTGAAYRDAIEVPQEFHESLQARLNAGEISPEQAARELRDEKLRLTQLKRPGLMRFFSFMSPQLRVATSDSVEARRVVEGAFEDSLIRERNQYGHTAGISAETEAKGIRDTSIVGVHNILDDEWTAYQKAGRPGGYNSFDEYNEQVWDAWRNDAHDVPEIKAAADRIAGEVYQPMETDLLDVQLLTPQSVPKDQLPPEPKISYGKIPTEKSVRLPKEPSRVERPTQPELPAPVRADKPVKPVAHTAEPVPEPLPKPKGPGRKATPEAKARHKAEVDAYKARVNERKVIQDRNRQVAQAHKDRLAQWRSDLKQWEAGGTAFKAEKAAHRRAWQEYNRRMNEFNESLRRQASYEEKLKLAESQRREIREARAVVEEEFRAEQFKWRQEVSKLEAAAAEKAVVPYGDKRYVPRVFDFEKIEGDRAGFKRMLEDFFVSEAMKHGPVQNLSAFRAELDTFLDDTVNKILDQPHGHYADNIVGQPGHLKGRRIMVPTKVMRDWLIRDPRDLTRAYFQQMAPRLSFKRRFDDWSLEDEIAKVNDEYARMLDAEEPGSRKYKRLTKQRERVTADIRAMRDIVLGSFGRPTSAMHLWTDIGQAIRTHNYITSLGGMTISAIPDMGHVIARIGMRQFARGFGALVTAPKRFGLARADARRMGAGLDAVLHTRAHSLNMLQDGYTKNRLSDKVAGTFSRWTGMNMWNGMLKQFTGVMFMDDIGRQLMSTKPMSPKKVQQLAAAGLHPDMVTRIRQQWQMYGDNTGQLYSPNIARWDDAEAARALSGAVLREVDTAVVTPSAGDLPLVSRTQVGRMVFQFKSFAISSTNRIVLSGMQKPDADLLMGWLMMMGLGSAVYGLKNWNAEREVSDDWNTIAYESWLRSGLSGYFGDLDNLADKLTRGQVSLKSAIGIETPISKYVHRSVINDMLGPTAGRVEDVAKIMGSLSTGDIKESDVRAMRRMIPGQNLFYLRKLLNEVEQAAAEEIVE